MPDAPALLAISHGTASIDGQHAVAALARAVAARLPGVAVVLGHVDVQQPDVAAALATVPDGQAAVIVPLLLSAGYHVHVDLVAGSAHRRGVTITPALGPDDRIVDVLVHRLAPLRPASADAVILAVAGSSDARANADCRATGRMLAARLGREVTVGFLAAEEPRLAAAVANARASGARRIVVADYLLAPGYFHDLAVAAADGCPVARPLLDDDPPASELVDIVVDRYRTAS